MNTNMNVYLQSTCEVIQDKIYINITWGCYYNIRVYNDFTTIIKQNNFIEIERLGNSNLMRFISLFIDITNRPMHIFIG